MNFWFPIDKVVHFLEYGIFGFLLTKAFLNSSKSLSKWLQIKVALKVILIAMVIGAIDESYQFLTKRNPSIYDWFADVIGATTFMIFTFIFSKSYRHRKYRSK